jgi:predicted transcriptional regulator
MQHMLLNLNNIQLKILSKLIFKKYYLRYLSKELNLIPSTVMRNLNILVDNKLIDSFVEGKNKYFFLPKNYSSIHTIKLAEQYRTLQFIKKHTSLLPILEDITKLSNNIIIFSSYAKGTQNDKSNLDILIIGKKRKFKHN